MEKRARFLTVGSIGGTDSENMPVPDVDKALPFYIEKLGFAATPRPGGPVRAVTLRRDGISFALAETGEDPEQASIYLGVDDVLLAREEMKAAGVNPTGLRIDQYGGSSYRIFFIKDPDGLCYCIGTKLEG